MTEKDTKMQHRNDPRGQLCPSKEEKNILGYQNNCPIMTIHHKTGTPKANRHILSSQWTSDGLPIDYHRTFPVETLSTV